MANNSVILLSPLSIDVCARGYGLMWSIPLTRVLDGIKDRNLAGAWCNHTQRLILVRTRHFYMFDIDRHKTRCVCECGCDAHCMKGPTMRPVRQMITPKYRFQAAYNDRTNSARFLACSHNRHLFYAYKCGEDVYKLEVHVFSNFSPWFRLDDSYQEQQTPSSIYSSRHRLSHTQVIPNSTVPFNGQLAAICVTHDLVAVVYRRYQQMKESITTKSAIVSEIKHYFVWLAHSLEKVADEEVYLPSNIRWITALVSVGTASEYLLCDPHGQQLLLYGAIDGNLIHRFRIEPVNACCLTDNRLVLWLQKAYECSPMGKLHIISPPHLENYEVVSMSMELLKQS